MANQKSRVKFTFDRVDDFTCTVGRSQSFLWDTGMPSLALRVTPTNRKTYVFEARLNGATVRINIGTMKEWPIEKARERAAELKRLVDSGIDPREVDRQKAAAEAVNRAGRAAESLTLGDAWTVYLRERRSQWGDRHYADHLAFAKAGGVKAKRGIKGGGLTVAGPLHSLLALRLIDLTPALIEAWAAKEAATRPTYGRLAWRCLKVFLTWCGEQPAYQASMAHNPAKSRRSREAFGKPTVKTDVLLREQLPAWFDAVRALGNPVASAYLQILLLTGARPGEVLAMRWEDINHQWRGLTIRDKVDGLRVVPLTPYVAHLLATLPRRNGYVFSSTSAKVERMAIPRAQHVAACKAAGLGVLTLHGLRRSFKSLTEWLEIPAGVVAQIMGHKPSATAEKHYTVRPLDLLRIHSERIEAWVLEQAKVSFKAIEGGARLQVVA